MRKLHNVLLIIIVCCLSSCNLKFSLPSLNLPNSNNSETDGNQQNNNSNNNDNNQTDEDINGSENKEDTNNNETEQQISYYGSDGDVYRINITTDNNKLPSSTSTYISGILNITEQDTTKILNTDSSIQIRVRGNSTSAPDKKPYRIKFTQGISLFGLTKAKDWVLLANYFDKSNIRNYLAYTLANKLDNLDFQPSSIFIDVYINEKYQGLYLLCEQIEANNGRVDIENHFSSDGINSFLVEVDDRAKDEYSGYENKCYFTLDEYDIAFKYPKASDYVTAVETSNYTYQDEYIKNVNWAMNFFYDALSSLKGNNYEEFSNYFDVDSFIDYYIVQEFFKNVDVSSTSQFYVIDQANDVVKIKCGPVWDFDISAGVVDNSQTSIYNTYTNTDLYVKKIDMFYRLMLENRTFNLKLSERYNQIRDLLIEIINEIETIENTLAKAQIRNKNTWSFPTSRQYWIEINAMATDYYRITTVDEHYDYLKTFLERRLVILDNNYL